MTNEMVVSRSFRLSFALPATFLALAAAASADLKETYRFSDGGHERTFEIAHNEAHFTTRSRTMRRSPITGTVTAEATRRAAAKIAKITGEQAELVMYEKGEPHNDYTRRILTSHIAVHLGAKADPSALAAAHQLLNGGPLSPGSSWYIFYCMATGGALDAAAALATEPGVVEAIPQLARLRQKRSIPNDPLFVNQWHLRNVNTNGSSAGPDVNITSVWDNWKGNGIRIGIVDDGLQVSHPDLAPNVDAVNDHDWNDSTADDPSPNTSADENVGDYHGTSCAGVAAGRGNNGIGVSGAAPEATLVGLRLIAAAETDQNDHDALTWKSDIMQVKSNSWGPADDGKTLEAPGTLLAQGLQEATTSGRGGLGTIITWAGGNGGDVGDNSNYDGYANSIYVTAVAAIGNNGVQSYYSEPGADIAITTPSNGSTLGITTVDLVGATGYNQVTTANGGDYCNDFGGTSSSSPLAAGCIAVILQSKPTLGYRDMKEILMKSATKCAATDADWITNAAGFHFNHKYGAGLLNTQAAVTLASTWTNLGPQLSTAVAQPSLNLTIPDGDTGGLTRTFAVTQSLRVEHVTVKVNITHARRGQLVITLTSPTGVISRLTESHFPTTNLANYANWTFMTTHDWGENSVGNWTLKVADPTSGSVGTLSDATLTVFGTTGNQPPVVSAATIAPTSTAFVGDSLQVSGVTASDAEGDAITLGYQWQVSTDGTTYTAISSATNSGFTATETQTGKMIRCSITPTSAGSNGNPYFTSALAIDHRPPQLAQTGQAFSYDSDLFLTPEASSSRTLIINEFSQGNASTSEWIELLTLRTADLRGYKLADAAGTYAAFASVAAWSAVPAGTYIVIYRGDARDSALPADDLDPADGKMIIPNTSTALFTSGTWGGLGNNGDSIIVTDAAGALVDGLSYSSGTQTPLIGAVAGGKAAALQTNTEASAEVVGNWLVISAALPAVTPGAGNGGTNAQFVYPTGAAAFRFAAASDVVSGLIIDATTGVVSGTPQTSGFFNVVIERYTGTQSATRTFPLLVTEANGSATLPSGKTLTLNGDYIVAGSLTVLGTLDTAGHNLTVGTLQSTSGTVLNASGLLSYLHRNGPLPPGATALISNAANDVADDDGDGWRNAIEFLLGTNPGAASSNPLSMAVVSGHLQITFSIPVGIRGMTPVVEVSSDLVNWNTGTGFTKIESDSTTGGLRKLTVSDAASTGPQYIRIRAAR